MAKYLHTQAISAALVDLVRKAKERLFIVSPYLKLSETMRSYLRMKDGEKVKVTLIFGKTDLQPDERAFLESLKYVRLLFSENLHAKCYLNEHEMVIASMNLYEFSQQNNWEMGVYISAQDDRDIYEDAWRDVRMIADSAKPYSPTGEASTGLRARTSSRRENPRSQPAPRRDRAPGWIEGFCIGCGDEIPFNPTRPFCRDCFGDWDGDEEERQDVCHMCGDDARTSFMKPVCYPCYKANREIF